MARQTPRASQSATADMPQSREQRMEAAGFALLAAEPGMALIAMRGGQTLQSPAVGDDLELYVDNGKGVGVWQGGYVALTEAEIGELGGPYDGQQVVWVGKVEANGTDREGGLRGDEWPCQYLRLARGEKPTSKPGAKAESAPEDQEDGDGDGDHAHSTAEFYRRDQRRGPGGQWADEGRARLRKYAMAVAARKKAIEGEYTDLDSPSASPPTAQEMQDALKAKLGIPTVDFDGNDLIAKAATTVLGEMADEGYPMPDSVLAGSGWDRGMDPGAGAAYTVYLTSGEDEMFFNEESPLWADEQELINQREKMGTARWASSDNLYHPVYHEMGHKVHRENSHAVYNVVSREDWQNPGESSTALTVSRYATTDPTEFVAEAFVGMLFGKTYPDAVMALYKSYGGPPLLPKRHKTEQAKKGKAGTS